MQQGGGGSAVGTVSTASLSLTGTNRSRTTGRSSSGAVHRQVLLTSRIAQNGTKKRKSWRASDSNDTDDDVTFKDMMHFMLCDRELEMRSRHEDRHAAERARQEEMDLQRQEVRMMNMMMVSMLSGQHSHHHRKVIDVIQSFLFINR